MILATALAAAALDPISFFRGRTQGEGTLKIAFQQPRHIAVDSFGSAGKDGWLRLDQFIREAGKSPRRRVWRFRQDGPDRFRGTLTDAAGPVRIDRHGNRLRIRYTDRKNFEFEQWLTPAGPGRVLNRMRVSRFGITFAHVDEVIRRVDGRR